MRPSAGCGMPALLKAFSLLDAASRPMPRAVPHPRRTISHAPPTPLLLFPTPPSMQTDTVEDARFVDSQFVKGAPHVRFYAGAPLVSGERKNERKNAPWAWIEGASW